MQTIPPDHTFSMRLRVTDRMTARFFDCTIHPVYATFALVEHGEYAARQAIIGYLDRDEDAVGSFVSLEHLAAAPVGAVVEIVARVTEVEGRDITCTIVARSGGIEIARGTQRQRIVSRQRLQERIAELYREQNVDN